MAVRLRMAVHGVRNNRIFHLVAVNQRQRRNVKPIELLGVYNPRLKPGESTKTIEWSVQRIQYWLGVGATPTKTVTKLLEMVRTSVYLPHYNTPLMTSPGRRSPIQARCFRSCLQGCLDCITITSRSEALCMICAFMTDNPTRPHSTDALDLGRAEITLGIHSRYSGMPRHNVAGGGPSVEGFIDHDDGAICVSDSRLTISVCPAISASCLAVNSSSSWRE